MQTEMKIENRGSLISALVSFHCCFVSLQLPQAKKKESQMVRPQSTDIGNSNFSDDNTWVF